MGPAALLVLVLALQAPPQNPPPSSPQAAKPPAVAMPNDWKVGETAHYLLTRRRADFQENAPVRSSSVKTPVTSTVTDRRAGGYTMRWTFGRGELIESFPEPKPFEPDQARIQEGLSFEFNTDATGSPTELLDPLAAEKSAREACARLADSLVRAGSKAEDLRWIEVLGASMSGKRYHEALLLEPRLLYMPSGSNLVLGERRSWEDRLPNPFGGAPLPSRAWLELREILAPANDLLIEWRSSVDVDKAGPALEASIREMARAQGKTLPAEAKVALGAIEDAATWIYDSRTGRPKSLSSTRTSVLLDTRRVESVSLLLVPETPK